MPPGLSPPRSADIKEPATRRAGGRCPMIRVGRVPWLIFVSSSLVALAFSLIALSSAEAQTTLGKPQPMLMTSYKWASLTERQREIYTRGFLETVSFILYGHSQKDNEQHAKIFSEWTLCAERQPLSVGRRSIGPCAARPTRR